MMNDLQISFIGCGNMTSAIIRGLIAQGLPANCIKASNPSDEKLKKLELSTGILTTMDNLIAAEFSDVIILGVKPKVLPQICKQLKKIDCSNKLIISIAAGVTTTKIAELFEQELALVRAMPNTPATIASAATGLYANRRITHVQKEIVNTIFSAIGTVEWVEQESLIDVVTAIAGSAPAYVFLFIQSMVEQATQDGLNPVVARNLATQAVLGAAKLAQTKPQESLDRLRKTVTSPGGTTAAAIESFQRNQFSQTIKTAISAAVQRGKELGEQA